MNRTQRITTDWILQSGLVGDELLLEGLLRRGFLAYRDDQGVWLGTGSHSADPKILSFVRGLMVKPITNNNDRIAQVKLRSKRVSAMEVAFAIVSLPDSKMWKWGVNGLSKDGWRQYRNMVWGAKMPACGRPEQYDSFKDGGQLMSETDAGAPDMGISLLVKTLPLARVATSLSCDGHGERSASISFFFQWDSHWGKAVFDVLACPIPNSRWHWGCGVHIDPLGGYGDAEVLNMLNDIQQFSRRLLNQSVINKIGRARLRTLDTFGNHPPTDECFANEASRQLAEEFA